MSNILISKSILNFKSRRKKAGLSLREVEKQTGISNAYISQIENGRIPIRQVTLGIIEKLHSCYLQSLTPSPENPGGEK